MDFDWKNSPLYLKLRTFACDGDELQKAQIIDEGISSANPVERAHWLAMKANQYAEHRDIPGHLDRAWDTLDAALQTAPDPGLTQFRSSLLQMALAIYFQEGPVERLQGLLRQMQPGLRQIVQAPAVSYNVAVVHHHVGHFRQARLWFRRALRANYLETLLPLGKVRALSFGAWLSFELSLTEEGEAYLQEARQLYELHGAGKDRNMAQWMAEAWAALQRKRFQEARTWVQQHMVSSSHRALPLCAFYSHVIAARIALAEGSPAGYRHYCDLARAVCAENDLSASRRYLQAIMADTERQYGAPARC